MTLESIEKLAKELLTLHNLPNWKFAFNDRKRTVGLCSYQKSTIFVSKGFAIGMEDAQIKNTLLHEIAHALVGPGHGHNHVWKAMAVKIGASPVARLSKEAKTPSPMERGAKWVCVFEGQIVKHWFRRPAKTTFAKLPTLYITNRKAETMGKLQIITVEEYNKNYA